jgi:hypothetical protein
MANDQIAVNSISTSVRIKEERRLLHRFDFIISHTDDANLPPIDLDRQAGFCNCYDRVRP